jgi:hypothetical protein
MDSHKGLKMSKTDNPDIAPSESIDEIVDEVPQAGKSNLDLAMSIASDIVSVTRHGDEYTYRTKEDLAEIRKNTQKRDSARKELVEMETTRQEGVTLAINMLLSSENIAIMTSEGWKIEFRNDSNIETPLLKFVAIDNPEETFEAERIIWKKMCLLAQNGSLLHRRFVKTICYENESQANDLNSALIDLPSRDDIPNKCTRCKETELPKKTEFRGVFPDLNSTSRWMYSKNKEWSLQIRVETPFYGYKVHEKNSEMPIMKISVLMCKSCSEQQSKLFSTMLKDL